MNTIFLVIASVFVFVAAAIHLLFFFYESVLWSKPATWKRFGIASQEHADIMKPMAFNQGFYNVFLALGAGIGLVLIGTGTFFQAGVGIAAFALLSMLLAAVVLITSNPKLARAALIQGLAPLLGILFFALALVVK
jgi:putative membrane protein